VQKWPY